MITSRLYYWKVVRCLLNQINKSHSLSRQLFQEVPPLLTSNVSYDEAPHTVMADVSPNGANTTLLCQATKSDGSYAPKEILPATTFQSARDQQLSFPLGDCDPSQPITISAQSCGDENQSNFIFNPRQASRTDLTRDLSIAGVGLIVLLAFLLYLYRRGNSCKNDQQSGYRRQSQSK